MKAVLALFAIYVGMFLVAIQGGSPGAVQAAPQTGASKAATASDSASVDPAKDADIRALLELVGARDQLQESVRLTSEQYRERLLASVANNQKNQAFVNAVISDYEKKFDVDHINEQLVSIYDKHYSDEEIKGLLQFYGSPLGQKVAAESPRIFREMQEATRGTALKAVKDALQETKQENPGVGQNARLGNLAPRRNPQARSGQQQGAAQQDTPQQAAQQQPEQR